MAADPPPPLPPPPEERAARLHLWSWLTLVAAAAVSLAAILLFPESGGDSPPLASLALVGGVIAAVTTAALSVIMRRELRLPARVTVSFAIAFALIAVVKFVLAPRGLYEVNAIRALDATVGSVADSGGAALTAVAIFGLYALAYWGLFWLGYGDQLPRRRRRGVRSERRIPTAVGCLLIAVGIVLGAALLFLGLIVASAPLQYLEFVFSSWAGIVIAVALVLAAGLILGAFRTFDDRPELITEVGAVVTLFWLGLGLLALFHVLWIVYVLVLGSIWPLRTVTPK